MITYIKLMSGAIFLICGLDAALVLVTRRLPFSLLVKTSVAGAILLLALLRLNHLTRSPPGMLWRVGCNCVSTVGAQARSVVHISIVILLVMIPRAQMDRRHPAPFS